MAERELGQLKITWRERSVITGNVVQPVGGAVQTLEHGISATSSTYRFRLLFRFVVWYHVLAPGYNMHHSSILT